MQIYSSEIVRIGEQANLFLDEGIVVFFGDNAPEELQDFAVIHKLCLLYTSPSPRDRG